VFTRCLQIMGTVLRSRSLSERIAYTRAWKEEVIPLLADRRVTLPTVATFPLAELAAAHALLEGNAVAGKVGVGVAD